MGGQSFLPTEILDYINTHAPSDASPYGVSQRELAKSLGYHPCSMSRPLTQLVDDGFLACRRGLVREGRRKQLVYKLTDHGRSRLQQETRRVPLLAGAIPPPPNPFLGRHEELDRLGSFAREGGAIMLVEGPPGMGKTALVSRHLRTVRRGRIPFWFTVRPASSPRQFVSALSHAFSLLGAPQLAYYSQLQRAPVAKEVADLAAKAVGERELAAVIDDIHLADANLRTFLVEFSTELVRRRSDQVYIVGQELAAQAPSDVRMDRMTLAGLDRSSAHELTDRKGGLAERFESVFQSTLGSPLLLSLAVSNPGIEASAPSLPGRVVERFGLEEIRSLLVAALSSEPLPAAVFTEQDMLTPVRLADAVRMGVLQKTQQSRLEMPQVVRTALLARVTPEDERRAHGRLARFYAGSRRPEAVRERFLHLVDGQDWKQASQLLSRQERAVFALGYSEALRGALRHLSSGLHRGPGRIRAMFAEAAILRHHSNYPEAIATLRRAVTEAGEDSKSACEGLLLLVEPYSRLRQVEDAEGAFESAERLGASTRRLQVFFELSKARILEARGDIQSARARYQEAFELGRRYRITDLALESVATWSRLEEVESGPQVALQIVEDALPEARAAGRTDVAFNLRLVRARAHFRLNQIEAADSEMRAVRSEAESMGYLNQFAYSLQGIAATSFERGQWAEGFSYARQACALAERLGSDILLGHTLAMMCRAEIQQSPQANPAQIEQALQDGIRSIEVLSRLPASDSLATVHGYVAEAYLEARDQLHARQHYDAAMDLCNRLELTALRDALEAELLRRLDALSPASS